MRHLQEKDITLVGYAQVSSKYGTNSCKNKQVKTTRSDVLPRPLIAGRTIKKEGTSLWKKIQPPSPL